jgi:hypothetical protein
MGHL